jgi:DNA primase subunit
MTFAHYLKTVDQSLYKQYVFESLKSNQQQKIVEQDLKQKVIIDSLRAKKTMVTSDLIVDSVLDYATRVDRLDDSHPCKQYVTSRMIGRDKWSLLYYTDDFKQFTNRFIPGKFKNGHDYLIDKEERLVIPFFDRHGKVTAFQGRSLDPHSKIRYYTIRLDETKPTIYGLERVDYSKPIYVCEAALDSLFIPNCISVNGACYQDPLIEQIKTNLTIIPDNERRNKEVCRQIEKMINGGFKVCLWPEGLPFKDINEAIQVGYTTDELLQIINDNVVCGLSGRIKFKLWTK